jgi:cellulose/xylan binding protein with CBM9 domain
MMPWMKTLSISLALICLAVTCAGQETPVISSLHARRDIELNTNADSPFWRAAQPFYAQVDKHGQVLPDYRTEIRTRWTDKNIYFLFVCPYKELYLKPAPDTDHETNQLWNWNVAEVFIGSNFKDIKRYKEFEVSPHNEWVDLDIDLNQAHHENGWVWNSGFEHVTRIDNAKHIWYVAMKIPFKALDTRTPAPGNMFRVNVYRTEGSPKQQKEIMWQPVMSDTFHVPERFGLLRLK